MKLLGFVLVPLQATHVYLVNLDFPDEPALRFERLPNAVGHEVQRGIAKLEDASNKPPID